MKSMVTQFLGEIQSRNVLKKLQKMDMNIATACTLHLLIFHEV